MFIGDPFTNASISGPHIVRFARAIEDRILNTEEPHNKENDV